MIGAKDGQPKSSSTLSWSSVTAAEGFKNGGLENKLSKCAKPLLLTSVRYASCSSIPASELLILPAKSPGAASCVFRS
jgi:hypothetical protein